MANPMQRDRVERLANSMRTMLWGVLGLSGFMNLLLLFGATYVAMLDDLVLPARNHATLFSLFAVVLIVYIVYGLLQALRARLLGDIAEAVGGDLSQTIHDGLHYVAASGSGVGDGLQPLHDMDCLCGFLAGRAPATLLDVVWVPLAILFLFALQVWLGVIALMAVLLIAGIAFIAARRSGTMNELASQSSSFRQALAEETRRNGPTIRAMGMDARFAARWQIVNRQHLALHRGLQRRSIGLIGTMRAIRLAVFALVVTVGTLLAFSDNASWSIAVAGALILYQATAPVDEAIASWGDAQAARRAWKRLGQLQERLDPPAISTVLPRPSYELLVEGLVIAAPGTARAVVQGVGFQLKAGELLAIIGGPGSGKSAMLNAVLGIWPIARGVVRFDGAALDQWPPDHLGASIGYLPQQAELINGTVAQNIARFDGEATADEVIAAAMAAGIHELILRLPEGYDTQVGRNGFYMSAGERQRVALARALFRDPFLVVLDDPTSNLDGEGEAAIARALIEVRERKGVAIIVTHRPLLLNQVDHIMHMNGGVISAIGPKARMLPRLVAGTHAHTQTQGEQNEQAGAQTRPSVSVTIERSDEPPTLPDP